VTIDSGLTAAGDAALRSSEAHAHAILDAALDAVITIDHRGHVLEFNRAAEAMFAYERDAVLGQELAALIVPPESRDAHRRALARWTEDGPTVGAGALLGRRIEVHALRSDGSAFSAELAISRVDVPGPPMFTACIRDITASQKAETALREAELRYRTLVEQLPLAVYIDRVDETSSNIYSSPQIEAMLGYTVEEWSSNPSLFVHCLHPEDRERVLEAHATTHATGEPLRLEYRLIARDGRVVWVHDEGRVVGDPDRQETVVVQGYLQDVTARKEAEDQLRHQAFHDTLTGLANRALFTDRVQHALVIRSDARGDVAVLFLDLDDFKAVNDSLGHTGGDTLLRCVGARLRETLSPSHTVARIGGDEFAILVEEGSGVAAAVDVAERVLEQFQEPFDLEERELFVTASVGIAVSHDPEELLRSANVAMYQAKASGGAQYVVYAPRMDEDVAGRMELVADLRRASVDEEFVLHYQPTVALATGAIVGVEALVRWKHPRLGLLAPSAFIPLAEETGRIVDIGRWVLSEACRQAAEWRRRPAAAQLSMSINVSTRQVRRAGLLEDVRHALESSALDPSALTLEITETVLAGPRDDLIGLLGEVQGLGVALALDDFGTGYSSLSMLQDLPVRTLKIDRAFIGAIGTGKERIAFVRAIVDLAEALGLTVVGEGIESPAHVTTLLRLGCRVGQGFYFAEPLEAAALDELFASGTVPRLPEGRSGRAEAA
jgi:diguanylate cyclase (GGDEF)-like protein/PAS domain S-box-containing protein